MQVIASPRIKSARERIENAKQTPSEVLLTGDFIVEAINIFEGTTKILARGGGEMKIK